MTNYLAFSVGNQTPQSVAYYRANDWLPVNADSCRPTTTPGWGLYGSKAECLQSVKDWQTTSNKWYRVDDELGYCIPYNGNITQGGVAASFPWTAGKANQPNPRVFNTYKECTGNPFAMG